jgi:predicted alpha/beta hydrolase family esterase
MPTAILLHGTGGGDTDYFWFADTRSYLTGKGYNVWWPLLPSADEPRLEETLSFLQANISKFAPDTIVIGHSSACPIILSLLERADISIKQAVLVAGFYKPLAALDISKLVLQENYDWSKIKSRVGEIILINSDNDLWGCTAEAAEHVAANLSAPLIVNHGQGHMGSATMQQPYREFSLLKRLID